MKRQIKVYAGEDTLKKWNAIIKMFPTNSTAFAVIVQYFFSEIIVEKDEIERYHIPQLDE